MTLSDYVLCGIVSISVGRCGDGSRLQTPVPTHAAAEPSQIQDLDMDLESSQKGGNVQTDH